MPLPITIPILSSGRAHSNAMRYFRLTAQALITYRSLLQMTEAKAAAIDPELPMEQGLSDMLSATEDASVTPVILGAMCLESALYDLGACLYGDEFSARIDKLDPPAKFSVIKHLVDRDLPKSGEVVIQTIQALVAARNRLVHHKSIPFDDVYLGKMVDYARKERRLQQAGIDASFRALVLLSASFDGNIFEELRILPSFKKKEYWKDQVPEVLHTDVQWCLNALERQRTRVASEPSAP